MSLHGFAHLCFLPFHAAQIWEENFEYKEEPRVTDLRSLPETLITSNESTNSAINSNGIGSNGKNILSRNMSPKYFIGHFINLSTYKNYGIKATLSPSPPPPSHNVHNCLLEHPIYYDLTLQEYNTRNNDRWTFKWVGWWNGDAGWMSSDPNCSVNGERRRDYDSDDDNKDDEKVDKGKQKEFEIVSSDGEQYIWFNTNRFKADREAQNHIKKFFPKLINETDQDDLNDAHICLGEMKVVVEDKRELQVTCGVYDDDDGGEREGGGGEGEEEGGMEVEGGDICEKVNEEDNSEFLADDEEENIIL